MSSEMHKAIPALWWWPMYPFVFFISVLSGWLVVDSYQKEIWYGMFVGLVVLALEIPWVVGAKGKYDDKHKEKRNE